MKISVNVNGRPQERDVEPRTLLVHFLREQLGLTGTHIGCETTICGACTVHVNGQPVRSCITPISSVSGPVTTIEGAASDRVGKAVQDAWVKLDVVQCGYCQSGQVMAATALLKGKKNPNDADIDAALAGILCRCGTYARIRAAVKDAARSLA